MALSSTMTGPEQKEGVAWRNIPCVGTNKLLDSQAPPDAEMALGGLRWVCSLWPRIPLRVLAILLTVLLVLWRSSALSLELTAATASAAEATTSIGVAACVALLFLLLDLSMGTGLVRHGAGDRFGRLVDV